MGFFAVTPKIECPHCIPNENILNVENFKDVDIKCPCF